MKLCATRFGQIVPSLADPIKKYCEIERTSLVLGTDRTYVHTMKQWSTVLGHSAGMADSTEGGNQSSSYENNNNLFKQRNKETMSSLLIEGHLADRNLRQTARISVSIRVPCFDDGTRACRQVRELGTVSEWEPGSAFQLSRCMASRQRTVPRH